MEDFIDIMLKPLVACLLLTGIHAYLGLHVIRRGVIFVDLSLAQLAAFGATLAFTLGASLHSSVSYFVSLGAALIGALFFALTRAREERIPQEAIIGIVYAVSAAASILLLSRAPEGGEELKSLLVGHLLFLDWPEVTKLAVLYSLVGGVHLIFRRPLLEASFAPGDIHASGRSILPWDLLFYSSFAMVVTSSVEVAGVLLVFSFLIVPAVCAHLLASEFRARLAVAWGVSFLTSVVGMAVSYACDLPTGATVVTIFGLAALAAGIARRVLFSAHA